MEQSFRQNEDQPDSREQLRKRIHEMLGKIECRGLLEQIYRYVKLIYIYQT